MQSEMPFYDCPEDALKAAVQALGGSKNVGKMLWPDMTPDNAGRKLMDALNPSRAEKLEISQIMLIMSRAKLAGCHAPFTWMASQIGYEARPVSAAEESDRLLDVIESSGKTLAQAMQMLQQIHRTHSIKVVS